MSEKILELYKTLTNEQQEIALDFITSLTEKTDDKTNAVLQGVLGILSESEADAIRTNRMHFNSL